MTKETEYLDALSKINPLHSLPRIIPIVTYQPTTGYFYLGNSEIEITSMTISNVSPVHDILIIERDKKVIVTKKLPENFTINDLEYIKDQLDDNGFQLFQRKAFLIGGVMSYYNLERVKGVAERTGKERMIGAIVAIRSATQVPSVFAASLFAILENEVKINESISKISLKMTIPDEPFLTRNSQRKIYQPEMADPKQTKPAVLELLLSSRNDQALVHQIDGTLKAIGEATFTNMTTMLLPLNISGLDIPNDVRAITTEKSKLIGLN
jgi:hypothetical protein